MTRNHVGMQRWEYIFCVLWLKEAKKKASERNRETAARYYDRKLFIKRFYYKMWLKLRPKVVRQA